MRRKDNGTYDSRAWAWVGKWRLPKLKQRMKRKGLYDKAEETFWKVGQSQKPQNQYGVRSATNHAHKTYSHFFLLLFSYYKDT